MMSVKTLALSLYDGTPLQKEGGKLINQQELANMDLDW